MHFGRHLIFAAAVFSAAGLQALEEFRMPRMQQNTYLSHARPAENFGLKTVSGENGLGYAGEAQNTPGQKAVVPFLAGNIPMIGISVPPKTRKWNTLLDTGSPVSWMEFGTSRDFGAVFLGEPKKPMPYSGKLNTGNVPGFAAAVPSLGIGEVELKNTPLYVRMALHSLGPLARGIEAPQVQAVLGFDLMQSMEYIRFDFQNREARFSSTELYVPDIDLLMSICKIVSVPEGGLAVEGEVSGDPTPVILDLAGDYHFSRDDVKVHVSRQISLGDVVWRKVPTLLLPTGENRTPRAGRRMLEKYIITICPKKGVVYFERLPE